MTPMPVFSHKSRSCLLARLRIQPLPAIMIGRLAFKICSTAWLRILSSATGRRNRSGCNGLESVSIFAMSSGNSIWQAPGFSVRASRTALRIISGILLGCNIVCAHLVTGSNILTTSII